MKNVLSLLALVLSSSSAFAGTVYMNANDIASLPDCNGTVQTKIVNNNTQLNLVFSNVVSCSNFDIVKANGEKVVYSNQKLGGKMRARSGSFTIPANLIEIGSNSIRVLLKSNSAKTYDTIVVKVKAKSSLPSNVMFMDSNDKKSLKQCAGTIKTQVNNGKLNIVFNKVENCSNFDILNSNGDKVAYDNQKIQQNASGSRSGSFTLPKRVIDLGTNTVYIQVKSNSGKTSDTVAIRFFAI